MRASSLNEGKCPAWLRWAWTLRHHRNFFFENARASESIFAWFLNNSEFEKSIFREWLMLAFKTSPLPVKMHLTTSLTSPGVASCFLQQPHPLFFLASRGQNNFCSSDKNISLCVPPLEPKTALNESISSNTWNLRDLSILTYWRSKQSAKRFAYSVLPFLSFLTLRPKTNGFSRSKQSMEISIVFQVMFKSIQSLYKWFELTWAQETMERTGAFCDQIDSKRVLWWRTIHTGNHLYLSFILYWEFAYELLKI